MISGVSPLFEDFGEILGSGDVANILDLKDICAAEKSSFNLFDSMESTITPSNSVISADETTGNQGQAFIIFRYQILIYLAKSPTYTQTLKDNLVNNSHFNLLRAN